MADEFLTVSEAGIARVLFALLDLLSGEADVLDQIQCPELVGNSNCGCLVGRCTCVGKPPIGWVIDWLLVLMKYNEPHKIMVEL